MISKEDFKIAEENQECIYVPGAVLDVPGWDDFINALSEKYNNPKISNDDIKNYNEQFIRNNNGQLTDIMSYNKLDPQFWSAARIDSEINLFPKSKYFIEYIKNIIGDYGWHIKALINFVGNENEYTAHKDNHHVVSWQCVGNVEYRIYDHIDSEFQVPIDHLLENVPYKSYILKPGDVIFMPAGVIHKAITSEPRATLILDRWENFYEFDN